MLLPVPDHWFLTPRKEKRSKGTETELMRGIFSEDYKRKNGLKGQCCTIYFLGGRLEARRTFEH